MKATLKNNIISYIKCGLFAILLAFNYELFITPNKFAPAGLNGIATMVQYKLGFSIGYMSLIINIPLCILAYFLVDKNFAKKTLVFCVIYSASFLLLQKFESSLQPFRYDAQGVDTIFPVIIAGIISGFVYERCFKINGSTGGTDIISKYISKKNTSLNFFWVTFIINVAVASISYFVYAETNESGVTVYNYKPVCLCMLYCFLSSFTGNTLLKNVRSAYKIVIVTNHAKEIDEEIVKTFRHSATQLIGRGVYSGAEKDVIFCVINKHQLVDFQTMLQKYDNTFAYIEMVNETVGNFKTIKKKNITIKNP